MLHCTKDEVMMLLYDGLLLKIGFTERDIADFDKYYKIAGHIAEPFSQRLVKGGQKPAELLVHLHKKTEELLENHTADMLLLLLATSYLHDEYEKKALPDKLFFDTMCDLKIKLSECYDTYGIFGCFCADWMAGYFRLERFALGRLQYDVTSYKGEEIRIGEYKVSEGDFAPFCHIPSGSPLTYEDYTESFRLAHEFFADKIRPDGILPILCDSWMLYPPYFKLFKEGSNSCRFVSHFFIYSQRSTEKFLEAWRIFNTNNTDNPSILPNKTGLQRAFIDYIKGGGSFGYAEGVILFDGKNILSENQYRKGK